MSSLAPHEPKIVGSNPAPATLRKLICLLVLGFALLACTAWSCGTKGTNGDPVPQPTWSTHVTCPPDCLPMAAGNPTKHA